MNRGGGTEQARRHSTQRGSRRHVCLFWSHLLCHVPPAPCRSRAEPLDQEPPRLALVPFTATGEEQLGQLSSVVALWRGFTPLTAWRAALPCRPIVAADNLGFFFVPDSQDGPSAIDIVTFSTAVPPGPSPGGSAAMPWAQRSCAWWIARVLHASPSRLVPRPQAGRHAPPAPPPSHPGTQRPRRPARPHHATR